MRKLLKNVLALVLIVALMTLAGCDGGFLTTRRAAYIQTPLPSATPEAADGGTLPLPAATPARALIPIDTLVYEAPDIEALETALDELLASVLLGGWQPESLIERYAELVDMYDAADSASQVAYLLYAQDVTADTYRDEYARIEEALLELDLTMTDLSVAVFESSEETERLARQRFGDGYVDTVYAEETLNSESVVELFVADNALQTEYDQLLATFSFMDAGQKWTYDDIVSDPTLSYERSVTLYERYCEALNREAGALFLEMLALRAEIAAKLGFGSYAAYRYACYGRDYTILDAQKFHGLVKKHIVPLYLSANERATDVYELYFAEYEQQAVWNSLERALAARPMPADALKALRGDKLYDFTPSESKMESSFTIYISALQTPYIFSEWENDSQSVGTLLHEFGHFMNYYYNPEAGWSSGDSLDLAEIDSQAFVLLMFPYYETLFGAEYAESARTEQLLDALYAIVTGSMEDEFQQRVYADPDMTLEEMNALYAQLAAAYGMDEIYGFTGTEWVLIPHSFQSPMYYISYAVSMVAALQIWSELDSGEDAWAAYMGVLMREPYAGFRATLAQNGLADPLSEAALRRVAERIDRSIQTREEDGDSTGEWPGVEAGVPA